MDASSPDVGGPAEGRWRFVILIRLRSTLLKALLFLSAILLLPCAALAAPKYKVLYSFSGPDGAGPQGRLTLDSVGNLYGATSGSSNSDGVVFELNPTSHGIWTYTMLHSFQYKTDGGSPSGGMAIDAAGNLYGTTAYGGTDDAGTVFELSPQANNWTFAALLQFGSKMDGLVLDEEGNMYGSLGAAAREVIHGPKGWRPKVLYSFCRQKNCQDGDGPPSWLTWDAAGNLYGTTETGGKGVGGDYGTAFELEHMPDGSWKHRLLHSFPAFPGDGLYADSGLLVDLSGNLYGTTALGGSHCGKGTNCGLVFELSPKTGGGWKETILHEFSGIKMGHSPGGPQVFDQAGNLYGIAAGGTGQCTCGVVYKLTPGAKDKWTYSIVYTFNGYDGASPAGGLIVDGKGRLYGTTFAGGPGGGGVVYRITP